MLYIILGLILVGIVFMIVDLIQQYYTLPKIIQQERRRTRRVCVRCLYEAKVEIPFSLQKYNATAEENEKILKGSQ